NVAPAAQPVRLTLPLPDLEVVGLDVPPVLQPGDTITPSIRLANFGTMPTDLQAPVDVALVVSTGKTFDSGSRIIALYHITNLPPISVASTKNLVVGDANLDPPANFETLFGTPVTLPRRPGRYNLGVVIDPFNTIREIAEV